MKARIIFTVASGLALAVVTYIEWKQGISPHEGYGSGRLLAFGFVLLPAAVLIGFIVDRWWVVLALSGSLLVLVCLNAAGDFARGDDGITPTSPPAIAGELWLAMFLLIGVGLRRAWAAFRSRSHALGKAEAVDKRRPDV
ncbi:MAG: hypothetical protein WD827_04825 [Solirubrobacterales bacterium]